METKPENLTRLQVAKQCFVSLVIFLFSLEYYISMTSPETVIIGALGIGLSVTILFDIRNHAGKPLPITWVVTTSLILGIITLIIVTGYAFAFRGQTTF